VTEPDGDLDAVSVVEQRLAEAGNDGRALRDDLDRLERDITHSVMRVLVEIDNTDDVASSTSGSSRGASRCSVRTSPRMSATVPAGRLGCSTRSRTRRCEPAGRAVVLAVPAAGMRGQAAAAALFVRGVRGPRREPRRRRNVL
jgi:hypothetical protein